MSVEEVKQILDLLGSSSQVTELSLTGASGGKVTVKRHLQAFAPVSAQSASNQPSVLAEDEEWVESEPEIKAVSIKATMVGLFHESNPPLAVGSHVTVGQIVGYIESMRLMNEIVSTVSGTVSVAQISENQPVEYGQPLFAVLDLTAG